MRTIKLLQLTFSTIHEYLTWFEHCISYGFVTRASQRVFGYL